MPARRDVAEIDIENLILGRRRDLRFQGLNLWMQAQLQDTIGRAVELTLYLDQRFQVPGIQDNRLFTDRIRPIAQRESNMGVMQIVGRTDRDVINTLSAAPQLVKAPVEPLKLNEEISIWEIGINDANTVIGIQGDQQIVPGILDRAHMAGRDITSRPDQRKILSLGTHTDVTSKADTLNKRDLSLPISNPEPIAQT